MGEVQKTMEAKLQEALTPTHLELVNDSHRHQGHMGDNGSGESHFSLIVVSSAFEGLNRLARQRLVNAALKDELAGPVHALSIRALSPNEPLA